MTNSCSIDLLFALQAQAASTARQVVIDHAVQISGFCFRGEVIGIVNPRDPKKLARRNTHLKDRR